VKNINNYTVNVLLEARTPSQLLYMLSYVNHNVAIKNTTILWSGPLNFIYSLGRHVDLPNIVIITEVTPSDSNVVFNYDLFFNIKKQIKSLKTNKNTILFTAFNHGIYYTMIKRFLSLSENNVFLFDDGSINTFQKRNSHMFIRGLVYSFHGLLPEFNKYLLFCNNKYNKIFTVFPKSVLPNCVHNKNIVNISMDVNNYYRALYSRIYKAGVKPNSALLLSHHAVESGRMRQKEYQGLIFDIVYKIKSYGVIDIYLSKHHLETSANDKFYQSLNLKSTYSKFPSELILASNNISIIAQPYNSTLLIAHSIGFSTSFKRVISYKIDGSPDIHLRKKEINKVVKDLNIDHCKM